MFKILQTKKVDPFLIKILKTNENLKKMNPYQYIFSTKIRKKTLEEIVSRKLANNDVEAKFANIAKRLIDFLVSKSSGVEIELLDKRVECLWRNFVFDTVEYVAFCYTYFGKIINYVPLSTKKFEEGEIAHHAVEVHKSIKEYTFNRNIYYDISHYKEHGSIEANIFYQVLMNLFLGEEGKTFYTAHKCIKT